MFQLTAIELNALYEKLISVPGVVIELSPGNLGNGPIKHLTIRESGGNRLEFIRRANCPPGQNFSFPALLEARCSVPVRCSVPEIPRISWTCPVRSGNRAQSASEEGRFPSNLECVKLKNRLEFPAYGRIDPDVPLPHNPLVEGFNPPG